MIIKTNHEEIFNLSEKELNKIDPEIYSFLRRIKQILLKK